MEGLRLLYPTEARVALSVLEEVLQCPEPFPTSDSPVPVDLIQLPVIQKETDHFLATVTLISAVRVHSTKLSEVGDPRPVSS